MSNYPLVSIVAACYNHAVFVVECLDSIVGQSYPNLELVVLDDCSKDNSVAVIEAWIAQNQSKISCKITFIPHKKNQGVCKTLNEGLSHCSGKYYQLIACDDVMLPHKIEKQVDLFEQSDESLAVVYTDALMIDENSVVRHPSFSEYWKFDKVPKHTFKEILIQNTIIAPTVLIRSTVLDDIGMYDESICFEDWDMWLRIATKYQFKRMDEALAKYRHFSTSFSQGKKYRKPLLIDSIALLEKHRGISKEIDALINEAQRPRITELIENNDARLGHLWKKLKYEKSAYSLFLFLCSLVGIDQEKAHRIKGRLKQ